MITPDRCVAGLAIVVAGVCTTAMNWMVTQKDGQPNLMFSWVERDGPLVKAPTTGGFGTLLISAALKDPPRVAFKETGLELEITVPFAEIVAQ